mmetsp:Transcript_19758/g.59713  ORF Transcript_19758/g.59713 Transcript_19758/m.59713 type:complete len:419 (+) Transcript_19758:295-1551(+)
MHPRDRAHPGGALPAAANRTVKWMCIDANGVQTFIKADKRTLIQQFDLAIPIRDMRLLDSAAATSQRGNIAVREGAIVFSIDYAQLIITAEKAIVPQPPVGKVEHSEFVEKLLAAVREAAFARAHAEEVGEEASSLHSGSMSHSYNPELPSQPFELVALEAALKAVCASYDIKAKQLGATINPMCDALLKKVKTSTLDAMRRLKTKHQRLLSAVSTLRGELESFLKDDDDIAKMCLSRRADLSRDLVPGSSNANATLRRSSTLGRVVSGGSPKLNRQLSDSSGPLSPGAQELLDAEGDAEAMEEVENLLESYFILIDRTWDRLTSLEEDMKDTESYVNIDLDSSQNRLFRLDIILTAAAFSIEIFHVMAGILGENVPIPKQITQTVAQFWEVNFATLGVCALVFTGWYLYLKWKRLLI